MITNLEYFRIAYINRVEKLVPILFEDNKTSMQLGKAISNTGKIKYINTAFYKVKDKSRKDIILLQ